MGPTYLSAFGLREHPFSKEIPDGDLWLPPSKQGVVDALLEALDERASVVLCGEPGVGKTCVLRALRRHIPTAGFRLTYCHNATLGRRDFYRQLCLALGLSPSATAAAVFYAVSTHVEDLAKERVHPVFLLDEAHLLHQDTLDHLHILLNYQWDSRALLSLVLVGLPELQDRLSLRRNRSLCSRIHHRLAVGPLTPDDTGEYVRLRRPRLAPRGHLGRHARRRPPGHRRPPRGRTQEAQARRARCRRTRHRLRSPPRLIPSSPCTPSRAAARAITTLHALAQPRDEHQSAGPRIHQQACAGTLIGYQLRVAQRALEPEAVLLPPSRLLLG
jgi:general secretion pathway protein A